MAANDWLVLPESEQIIDLRELFFIRRSGMHTAILHFKNDKHSEVSLEDARRVCEQLGLRGEDVEPVLGDQQRDDDDPREEYDVLDELEVTVP